MISNARWLELGVDWEALTEEKGVLTIIPNVVSFRVLRHPSNIGGYSSFHQVCGSTGQKQFGTEWEIKAYLESQIASIIVYTNLMDRHKALARRMFPLQTKMDIINKQINALY